MTTPNLPELKRLNMWVQEQDKLEPGAGIWVQDDWATLREETPMCQTAYCVAGMTIVRAGHTLYAKMIPDSAFGRAGINSLFLDGEEADEEDIVNLAVEALGIENHAGALLFAGTNKASDVDQIIRGIFLDAGADYDAIEPAPDLEIEIKAAEAVQPQLLPNLINV